MSLKTHKIASALLGLGLLISAGTAEAKVKTVKVTGEAAAVAGDRAATEKAAKRAARRKAIEEGAGVLVQSNTIVRNFQMVSDEIATSAKGVITDEQWGPVSVHDGVATVTLTAKVSPDAVENAICTVVKANHDPSVALVFVERTGKADAPFTVKAERGMIESIFTSAFMDNCFKIVESGVRVSEVAANGDLPQETINKIIANSGAQYVVLGKAETITLGEGVWGSKNTNSYAISAHLRLINAETNAVEAVVSGQRTIAAISPSSALTLMRKGKTPHDVNARKKDPNALPLVDELMDQMFKSVSAKWTNDLVNSAKVSVTVKGLKNYKAAKDFRAGVEKTIKGSKVTQRSLKKGVAIMDIEVEGGADALATAIDEKKFGKFTVEVIEVVPGKVILQLK